MNVEPQAPDEPLLRLFRRLGSSDEAAGDAYEALRRLLCRFFEVRGAPDAEGLADQVLDRVSTRVRDGVEIDDIHAYARGVARLVLLESRRRPVAEPLTEDPPDPSDGSALADDAAARCLDRCLGRLGGAAQAQVMAYYSEDGRGRIDGRKRLAAELGVSATALRLRMLRLRLSLEQCVRGCVHGETGRNSQAAGNTHR